MDVKITKVRVSMQDAVAAYDVEAENEHTKIRRRVTVSNAVRSKLSESEILDRLNNLAAIYLREEMEGSLSV